MIALSNIKSIEYELPANVMVVHLHKAVLHNGYRTFKLVYKISYEEFLKRGIEWRKYHSSI